MATWWFDSENNTLIQAVPNVGVPGNFQEVEGVDLPRDRVYFNGAKVVEKPAQPEKEGVWQWREDVRRWVNLDEAKSLNVLKIEKLQELSAQCQAAILAGFESPALGALHRYSSQLEDQANLTQANVLAQIAQQPISYVCTDLAGVKQARMHTPEQLAQVLIDGGTIKAQLIYKFHELRQQVEAAGSLEEVKSVQW